MFAVAFFAIRNHEHIDLIVISNLHGFIFDRCHTIVDEYYRFPIVQFACTSDARRNQRYCRSCFFLNRDQPTECSFANPGPGRVRVCHPLLRSRDRRCVATAVQRARGGLFRFYTPLYSVDRTFNIPIVVCSRLTAFAKKFTSKDNFLQINKISILEKTWISFVSSHKM